MTSLSHLQSQASSLEGDIGRLTNEKNALERAKAEYHEQQGATYNALAAIYLPDLSAKSVQNTIDGVRNDVHAIFEAQQSRKDYLERRLQNIGPERETIATAHDANERILKERNAIYDEASTQRADTLASRVDYTAAKTEEDTLSKQNTLRQARIKTAEGLMDTYGSLFASDPIFAHLMRKGFGTEEYKAGATITRLDRLLAAVTHYPEEKERYDGIKDAVTAMQQDLALTDAARNVVAGRIASIEEEVERGVDLPRKHADLESAIKEKERLLQTISQFDHERKTCDNELSAINTKDNYYARALAKVVAYLQSQDSRALGKIAASTKTSADDKLVENLARICDDITKNERTIADITARRTSVQQTLESVQDDIRRERRRIEDEERRAAERRRQEAAEAAARAAEAMRRAAQQSSHRQSSIGGGGFGGGGHRTTGGF